MKKKTKVGVRTILGEDTISNIATFVSYKLPDIETYDSMTREDGMNELKKGEDSQKGKEAIESIGRLIVYALFRKGIPEGKGTITLDLIATRES